MLSVDNPIKSIGSYVVKAKLFTGVEAEFSVKVDMDPKQAEEMKAKAEAAAKKKKAKAEAGEVEGEELFAKAQEAYNKNIEPSLRDLKRELK